MARTIVIIAEEREINSKTNFLSVSLDFSSKNVTQKIIISLKNKGYNVIKYSNPEEFLENIKQHKDDIVFSTLWGGQHSRNKRSYLSSICEAYNIKYIGSDTYVQALCQDKYLSKLYLKNYTFKIPKAIEISSVSTIDKIDSVDFFPCIVKPSNEGSSVGISDTNIVMNKKEAKILATKILNKYSPVLIEELIDGREVSICLAGTPENIYICEVVELLLNNKSVGTRIWGFESKKAGKSIVSRKIITKDFPEKFINEAKRIFINLDKVDLIRIDGKWINDNFYIIELSPDCSLHESCFMSTAFKHNNYSYEEMLDKLVDTCMNC